MTVRVPAPVWKRRTARRWKYATIPAYQRRTKQADALIVGAYLAGTNTRLVRGALAALFGGAVGRIAHRMQLNVCTKSSSGESRPKPCCLLSASKGAETAAMLFWALLASGQITMRKADGPAKPQRKAIRSDD
jgi:hypothetical protein